VRKFRRIAIFATLLIGFTLINRTSLVPEILKFDKKPINFLSGLPGTNGPLLAVKIDDTKEAHPQVGIGEADLVYVEQVESGLTRLLALYSSNYPEKIGPVRSARISDIDLLAQYGRVAFAYSGSQTKMRPVLAEANLNNLSAERNPPSIFSRDETRTAPVNMMLDPNKLLEQATSKLQMNLISLQSSPWQFGEISRLALPVQDARVKFPNARYQITWDSTNGCWQLAQNGTTETNSLGKDVCIDNAIIQVVEITPSIYGDKFGGITPLSKTVGSGSAVLLRDGKYLNIYWQRDTPTYYTKWIDKGGEVMKIKAGKTWIFLTSTAPTLTFAP
jgi:hypothetical protein